MQPQTAVITGEVFEKHRPPGYSHPERPARVRVIREEAARLASDGIVALLEPRSVPLEEATRVHDQDYVGMVAEASEYPQYLDPDTYVGPGSLEAALHALGTAYEAARLAYEGRYRVVYAAVRPPGHHAGKRRAAGFCLFNNIAYAAQRMIEDHGLKRIAIIDVDAHWGDGTAEIFYDRRDVLYISFHQDPRTLYPGRGFPEELGRGEGLGYTVNIMMPPLATDQLYLKAWHEIAMPILERYKPQLILVSLGFDAHKDDPLTDLALTLEGYWALLREVLVLAERLTGRGLALMLEGGYDLRVLRDGVRVVASLTEEEPPVREESVEAPGETVGRFRRFVERVKKALEPYWEL
ncbi:histone deacetylase superfamily [Pyrolobus fumarii 1A]|uniref:Histone deacetylase superfamily n=1 Tax=Pyrolobus fumarii (strain DSM 11204 / 1A) TaxID=694429 RepID=G0EDY8_PYRF1|nr:histone deacetylase family protein [Pyrolobus fumarii]AEM37904.1 histone deacetylase superfamily [Pyrolobus fumarii 1A]